MVRCSNLPFSVGRLRVKPAPNGVTSINLVTSIHSKSGVSRQLTRTGSFSSSRSRIRFSFISRLELRAPINYSWLEFFEKCPSDVLLDSINLIEVVYMLL